MTPEDLIRLEMKLTKVMELLLKYEKEPKQPEVKIPIRLEKDAAVTTCIQWVSDSLQIIKNAKPK